MHKIMYEALMRITWDGFLQWLGTTRESDHLNEVLSLLKDLAGDVSESALQDVVPNASYIRIVHLFQQYHDFLRNDNGSLSGFWMSYLDMVEILLGLGGQQEKGIGFCTCPQFGP